MNFAFSFDARGEVSRAGVLRPGVCPCLESVFARKKWQPPQLSRAGRFVGHAAREYETQPGCSYETCCCSQAKKTFERSF